MENIFRAAHSGHEETLLALIRSGSSVNRQNAWGETPLHIAIAEGHPAAVKILLDHGALVDARDRYLRTPLLFACVELESCNRDLSELVIPAKHKPAAIDLDGGDQSDDDAAEDAVRQAQLTQDLHYDEARDNPERHAAVMLQERLKEKQKGLLDTVRMLLERGADTRAGDAIGRTARGVAAVSVDPVMRTVFERLADVTFCKETGRTVIRRVRGLHEENSKEERDRAHRLRAINAGAIYPPTAPCNHPPLRPADRRELAGRSEQQGMRLPMWRWDSHTTALWALRVILWARAKQLAESRGSAGSGSGGDGGERDAALNAASDAECEALAGELASSVATAPRAEVPEPKARGAMVSAVEPPPLDPDTQASFAWAQEMQRSGLRGAHWACCARHERPGEAVEWLWRLVGVQAVHRRWLVPATLTRAARDGSAARAASESLLPVMVASARTVEAQPLVTCIGVVAVDAQDTVEVVRRRLTLRGFHQHPIIAEGEVANDEEGAEGAAALVPAPSAARTRAMTPVARGPLPGAGGTGVSTMAGAPFDVLGTYAVRALRQDLEARTRLMDIGFVVMMSGRGKIA